jgi:hypothetical protein
MRLVHGAAESGNIHSAGLEELSIRISTAIWFLLLSGQEQWRTRKNFTVPVIAEHPMLALPSQAKIDSC